MIYRKRARYERWARLADRGLFVRHETRLDFSSARKACCVGCLRQSIPGPTSGRYGARASWGGGLVEEALDLLSDALVDRTMSRIGRLVVPGRATRRVVADEHVRERSGALTSGRRPLREGLGDVPGNARPSAPKNDP